tara:strand:- start:4255 stop:4407 length:153 start_codon:yes stop_codon:yes gene_type:complete
MIINKINILSNIKDMVRSESDDKYLGSLVRQYITEINRQEELISNNPKHL